MPKSPVTAKTGSTKIKPMGQTSGKHHGTNSNLKVVGRSTTPVSDQSKLS
jgi:hypothetical protein